MNSDHLIDDIHKFREGHARKFNYDLQAIFSDLRRKQSRRKNVAALKPVKPTVSCVAEPHATYGNLPAKKASNCQNHRDDSDAIVS